jgi:glucoamylase
MRLSLTIALVTLGLGTAAPAALAVPQAPGAPGAKARWLPADKHGFGTSRSRRSHVWFTLRQNAMSEAYYPDLGTPSVRSLEFAVTDGKTFTTRDSHESSTVRRLDGLNFRQTTTDRRHHWRLTKVFTTDPRRNTIAIHVSLRSLRHRRLALYAILDPALSDRGGDDRGATRHGQLLAHDAHMASVLRSSTGFTRTSSSYAGRAGGWAELRRADRLVHRYRASAPGNVVQLARLRVNGTTRRSATLALSFGRTGARARQAAAGSLRRFFSPLASENAAGWRAYRATLRPRPAAAASVAREYETSVLMLAASEDKLHPGASVASPTMPWTWGQLTLEKPKTGPYHLVWARDLYEVATAAIADGDTPAANRELDFLLDRQQKRNGSFPQNTEVSGKIHWTGLQMDEVADPILLAWQLGRTDRWPAVRRAAGFLVSHGPKTGQERWENQEGWSPATIAAEIAGLVTAGDLARRTGHTAAAARYDATADRWQRKVQGWTATSTGPYSKQPYYLRITKDGKPDRGTRYSIGDGGPGKADQRTVIDPSFLELVRLGVKRFDDPVVLNTLRLVDRRLRVATPDGAFFHRFTFDGYGETRTGAPWYVSTKTDQFKTLGRAWPIFAGERGEYELLAGRPATAELAAMAAAANDGGMIPEQVWDGRAPTGRGGRRAGEGTQSATPLLWSHAQLVRLAWSIEAGRPVEQPSVVACRYAGRCP